MKIRIDSHSPRNRIELDNDREAAIFQDPMLKSKLAYKVVENLEGREQLSITEGSEYQKTGERSIVFPTELYGDTRKMSFYLRVLSDWNSVTQCCMPIHAAAFQMENKIGFLLGDTNGGKSTTLENLCGFGVMPIGDDHIILGNNTISGNDSVRIRGDENDTYQEIGSVDTQSFEDYKIFLIGPSETNEKLKFNAERIYQNSGVQSMALKYLREVPKDPASQSLIKEVTKTALGKYNESFKQFAMKAIDRINIVGSPEYISENIFNEIRRT